MQPHRPDSVQRDVVLRDAIERAALEFPGYGYHRVSRALAREWWDVSHKCMRHIMRGESLLCRLKQRFFVTTDSRHGLWTAPQLPDHWRESCRAVA